MNTINTINNSNPNFNGLTLRPRKLARLKTANLIDELTALTQQDTVELTNGAGPKKLRFFRHVARKFNHDNFHLKKNEQQTLAELIDIFHSIKNPRQIHADFIDEYAGNLKEIADILKKTNNSKKLIKLAYIANKELGNSSKDRAANIIADLVSSPHAKEYARHFNKYESYLKLNKADKDAITKLDKMLEDGTYNAKHYDDTLEFTNHAKEFPFKESEVFNSNIYAQHFTEEKDIVISSVLKFFNIPMDISKLGNDKILLNIFNTTTPKNYQARLNIIERYPSSFLINRNQERNHQELIDLDKLFTTIDTDKHAKKFVLKMLKENVISSTKRYNELFASIEPKKLNIFSDNVYNILKQVMHDENFIPTVKKEIENPYFETELTKFNRENNDIFRQEYTPSKLEKIGKGILNIKNKITYYATSIFSKKQTTTAEDSIVTKVVKEPIKQETVTNKVEEKVVKINTPQIKETKPEVVVPQTPVIESKTETITKQTSEVQNNDVQAKVKTTTTTPSVTKPKTKHETPKVKVETKKTKVAAPKVSQETNKVAEALEEVVKKVKIRTRHKKPKAKTIRQQRAEAEARRIEELEAKRAKTKAKKAEVKREILDIITSKLGKKTLERQQKDFGVKATQIRLSLLPEIFASIKDTRKMDRAVGKAHINSSNKDALELYSLITGSNKKFVNYLLKQRNVDNSRMFEVKAIINEIKQAEAKIAKKKQANPDYKPNDARKYYNHLYEAKIQEYGKLKRQTKLSTNA